MRRRVEDDPAAATRPTARSSSGRGGLRDIEFAVQLLQLVHGRADETLRSGTTLVALSRSPTAATSVGRTPATSPRPTAGCGPSSTGCSCTGCGAPTCCPRRRRGRPAPAGPRAAATAATSCRCSRRERAGYGREVRRLHEKLFYRPLLAAVARLPADAGAADPGGRAGPAGGARLRRPRRRAAPPRGADRGGLAPGGDPADAAARHARLVRRRRRPRRRAARLPAGVSDALGTTPWYLRLLRDEGEAAERLARLLASSRYVADLLARAPEAVKLLGRRRRAAPRARGRAGAAPSSPTVRRRDDWEAAVAAARGLRRQELLRIACADLLGLVDRRAGRPRAVRRRRRDGRGGAGDGDAQGRGRAARRRCRCGSRSLAMGRLGGGEQGYGSDADVLFVHEAAPGRSRGARPRRSRTTSRTSCAGCWRCPPPTRRCVVDADLRPEGRQGPLTRSLGVLRRATTRAGRRSGRRRRCCAPRRSPATPTSPQAFLALVEPVRYPAGGLTDAQVVEVRRIKARVEKERLPARRRPAARASSSARAASPTSSGPCSCCSCGTPHGCRRLRTTAHARRRSRRRARPGLLDADDAAVLEHAWTLAAGSATRSCWCAASRPPRCRRAAASSPASPGRSATLRARTATCSRTTVARPARARTVVERTFYA